MKQKIISGLLALLIPSMAMGQILPSATLCSERSKKSACRSSHPTSKPPKLTVIFVMDGVPKASLDKVNAFLKGGIKFLRENSLNYQNVLHPHANCSTGQGHAALTTGTFPCYHGIVNNYWLDATGNLFSAIQDNDLATSGVIDPTNGLIYNVDENSPTISSIYPAGISPRNYRVDNLSDQLSLFSTPEQQTKVFAISSAPEPAVLMAGRLGKAFWLDGVTGLFTSSTYYFPGGLPGWVQTFNKAHPVPSSFVWPTVYPVGSAAYQFPGAQNYQFSVVLAPPFLPFTIFPPHQTIFGETIQSIFPIFGAATYTQSPLGLKTVFDLGKEIITTQLDRNNKNENLVLWLNLVSFDTLSGFFGPQAQEAIDIIYHLDQEVGRLMKFAYKKIARSECLFLFCSDEGYIPAIPEILNEQGFDLAQRTITSNAGLPVPDLITTINNALGTPYVQMIIPPFVYLNLSLYNLLTPVQKESLLNQIKDILRSQRGIKDAWSFDELIQWPFEREDQGRFFKLHLFRNNPSNNPPQERRSGEVIFQSFPFNMVISDPKEDFQPIYGADHTSVYDYDAHTPLYLYQSKRFKNKVISEQVISPQIAVTLSTILNVPRPSASSVDIQPLPGIHYKSPKE